MLRHMPPTRNFLDSMQVILIIQVIIITRRHRSIRRCGLLLQTLSACLSVTIVSLAKTAEPIQMPYGLWARVGSRNHVLHGVQIAACELQFLGGNDIPEHD